MRRRSGDVFELGEEQLLDEPAVELSDAEDPLAIPPAGGGPADEETGPASATAAGDAATSGRSPILDAIGRAGSIRSVAAIALLVGVLTFAATRLSTGSSSQESAADARQERASDSTRIRTDVQSEARDARQRGEGERSRARKPELSDGPSARPPTSAAAPRVSAMSEDSLAVPDLAPSAVSPAPSVAQSDTAVAPAEPASPSRGEVIFREFGP